MTFSDTDIERILSAAETIDRSLDVLTEKRTLAKDEYRADQDTQDIVERRFVKATQAALDIAKTVLVHERGTQPESNPAAMQELVEIGVLDGETGTSMAQAARFRNVLAHTYGDIIDEDIVYDSLHDLDRYQDFLVQVRAYLDESDSLDT